MGKDYDFNSWFSKILAAIDTIWGKIAFIGAIFCAGCISGCYYKETIMMRKQIEEDELKRSSWHQKEDNYRNQIIELNNRIISLQEKIQLQNTENQSHETKEKNNR